MGTPPGGADGIPADIFILIEGIGTTPGAGGCIGACIDIGVNPGGGGGGAARAPANCPW